MAHRHGDLMTERINPPEIVVRVPGPWLGPEDFAARLPEGYRLSGNREAARRLLTPDDRRLDVSAYPADEEFLRLFATGCRREPSDADKRGVETYRVNVCLTMPGGSLESAGAALRDTVALLDAGGHGVFVDNSGIAHGSDDWRALAADTGPDGGGPFWAYVITYGSQREIWSLGMHCLGCRDAVMPRGGDDESDDLHLRNFLAYSYRSGAVIEDGHFAGTHVTPLFRVTVEADTTAPPGHPMHNPYGRYRLHPSSSSAAESIN